MTRPTPDTGAADRVPVPPPEPALGDLPFFAGVSPAPGPTAPAEPPAGVLMVPAWGVSGPPGAIAAASASAAAPASPASAAAPASPTSAAAPASPISPAAPASPASAAAPASPPAGGTPPLSPVAARLAAFAHVPAASAAGDELDPASDPPAATGEASPAAAPATTPGIPVPTSSSPASATTAPEPEAWSPGGGEVPANGSEPIEHLGRASTIDVRTQSPALTPVTASAADWANFLSPAGSPTRPARASSGSPAGFPSPGAFATAASPGDWEDLLNPAAPRADGSTTYNWQTIVHLRDEAARDLSETPGFEGMTEDERLIVARRVIRNVVVDHIGRMMLDGEVSWDEPTQSAAAQDVFNMLFKLGRIQPLMDDPTVEDIHIHGRTTWIRRAGRALEAGPPVAETPEELIEFLQFIAGRVDPPRAFNPTQPVLNLDLGVGRLNATYGGITAEPDVTIRLHRHQQVTLDELVALGTVTPVMASFLSAAVKTNLSIIVAGEMGAGKTTLVRALCGEIPPSEPIATIETDFELRLHEQPDQHWVVKAWQERQGHGDARQDGSRAGAFTVDDALFESFRQSVDRVIVGEVRGREIIGMIKAMQSGTGSLSTTHAQSARGAIDKLVTCAMETGVSEQYALRALGTSIKLVVYIRAETIGRSRHRVVTEIVAVGFKAEGIEFTDVFTRPPGGTGAARGAFLPDHLRSLAAHGFDESAFNAESRQFKMEAGL